MNLDILATRTRDVACPTAEQLDTGRLRLALAIHAADVRGAAARGARHPRRWGITALAASAAVAALLVAPLLSAPPASAEEVMLAAADAAGRQVDETAGAAYWHVTSEVDSPSSEPFRRETWQGRSGDTILRDERLTAQSADGGQADPALVHVESLRHVATFVVGGDPLGWAELERLPTDSTALEEVLREKVRDRPTGEDDELWESVTGLLRESPASPALRRALWQVAASIPGVELLGTTTDAAGREGTALERSKPGEDWYRVYVLDPADGTLLETRNVRADGTVIHRVTEMARVGSATAPTPQAPRCGTASDPVRPC